MNESTYTLFLISELDFFVLKIIYLIYLGVPLNEL